MSIAADIAYERELMYYNQLLDRAKSLESIGIWDLARLYRADADRIHTRLNVLKRAIENGWTIISGYRNI